MEFDQRKSNKDVALSVGIPQNILSNRKKTKERIFEAYKDGMVKIDRVKSDAVSDADIIEGIMRVKMMTQTVSSKMKF